MSDSKKVEIYFDPDGSVAEVNFVFNVSGNEVRWEFWESDVAMFAFYPEDVDRVEGEPTEITAIVLPEKPLPKDEDDE